jgi:hypothetical protein
VVGAEGAGINIWLGVEPLRNVKEGGEFRSGSAARRLFECALARLRWHGGGGRGLESLENPKKQVAAIARVGNLRRGRPFRPP